MTTGTTSPTVSALAPLRSRLFLMLWLAALVSNIGTWTHAVGASWLLADLDVSPFMVSLVQTANTLPFFFLALPAGALADIVDRRKLLIAVNLFMMAAAGMLAFAVWQQHITAGGVLGFTFLLGVGSALLTPAWQALIPSTVSRENLPQALALGSININLSRAFGPALAGMLVTAYGLASPFFANTLSFITIISALLFAKPPRTGGHSKLPPEKILRAVRAGIRYARYSVPLQSTMLHVFGFMFFANAFWGLAPIIAKRQLAGDAAFFGYLMGAVGVGGVLAGLFLPTFKRRLKTNQMVTVGSAATAAATGYFAFNTSQWLALPAGFFFGIGWLLALSNLNVSAQQALPDWARARGLAIYLMVFYGGISLGAAFWGWFATRYSIPAALQAAASGAVLFIWVAGRIELLQGDAPDLTPSLHWPIPVVSEPVAYHRGPVVITIQYLVKPEDKPAFLAAVRQLQKLRLKHGVYQWGIYEDTERNGQFLEIFLEDNWGEHLRHHERMPKQDKLVQDQVLAFHTGSAPPLVRHLIAPDAR